MLQLVLHELNSLGVKFGLKLGSGLDYVKILEEIVEANHAQLQIVNTHAAVVVEVEAHPGAFHGHTHLVVSVVDVVCYLLLFIGDHVDVGGNCVGGLIVQEEHVLNDWSHFSVQQRVQLLSVLLDDFELIVEVNSLVDLLVQRQAFDLLYFLLAVVESDVQKFERNLLELVEALWLLVLGTL